MLSYSDPGRFDAPFLLRSKLSAGDGEIVLVGKQPLAYVAAEIKRHLAVIDEE